MESKKAEEPNLGRGRREHWLPEDSRWNLSKQVKFQELIETTAVIEVCVPSRPELGILRQAQERYQCPSTSMENAEPSREVAASNIFHGQEDQVLKENSLTDNQGLHPHLSFDQ